MCCWSVRKVSLWRLSDWSAGFECWRWDVQCTSNLKDGKMMGLGESFELWCMCTSWQNSYWMSSSTSCDIYRAIWLYSFLIERVMVRVSLVTLTSNTVKWKQFYYNGPCEKYQPLRIVEITACKLCANFITKFTLLMKNRPFWKNLTCKNLLHSSLEWCVWSEVNGTGS